MLDADRGKTRKNSSLCDDPGYSRRMFARATLDERLARLLHCHEQAFEHFGGTTHQIVYDNAKTVVLSRDVDGRKVQWNPTFWDFSTYYGFQAWAHRPYRAQTKGKVESWQQDSGIFRLF